MKLQNSYFILVAALCVLSTNVAYSQLIPAPSPGGNNSKKKCASNDEVCLFYKEKVKEVTARVKAKDQEIKDLSAEINEVKTSVSESRVDHQANLAMLNQGCLVVSFGSGENTSYEVDGDNVKCLRSNIFFTLGENEVDSDNILAQTHMMTFRKYVYSTKVSYFPQPYNNAPRGDFAPPLRISPSVYFVKSVSLSIYNRDNRADLKVRRLDNSYLSYGINSGGSEGDNDLEDDESHWAPKLRHVILKIVEAFDPTAVSRYQE